MTSQTRPPLPQLQQALADAAAAHHEYEQNALAGRRDEQWPAFYAAFVLGRLGPFVAPSTLSTWLSQAPASEQWAASTARFLLARLGV